MAVAFCLVNYLLPPILLMTKIISATTATTRNIPTPIPALNIPPMISQLVNNTAIMDSNNILGNKLFMICYIKLVDSVVGGININMR